MSAQIVKIVFQLQDYFLRASNCSLENYFLKKVANNDHPYYCRDSPKIVRDNHKIFLV